MADTDFFDFKDPYVGQVFGGEFRIESQIGAGGMGAVYRATQAMTEREVAVKVLHRHLLSETVLKRFRQEAQIISRLNHPNIVTVFKYGQHDDGSLYIAMELVEGRDLTTLIQARAMQDPARSLPLMVQMAEAVGYAHDMKIVHRDIKPENMIVGRVGRDERVKILDFGIAKIIDTKYIVTKTGMLCGSPPYMAPEQWSQVRDVDGRTDLYALGCVFYAMLTSRLPYEADNTPGYMSLHLEGSPVPPMERNPALAALPALNDIILKAMATDRADRYADAFALRDALEDVRLGLRAPVSGGASHPSLSGGPAVPSLPDTAPPESAPAPERPRDPAAVTPGEPHAGTAEGARAPRDARSPRTSSPRATPTVADAPSPPGAFVRTASLAEFSYEGEGTSVSSIPRTVLSDHGDSRSRRVHATLVAVGLLLLVFLAGSFSYYAWIAPTPAPIPSTTHEPRDSGPPRAAPASRGRRPSPATRGSVQNQPMGRRP